MHHTHHKNKALEFWLESEAGSTHGLLLERFRDIFGKMKHFTFKPVTTFFGSENINPNKLYTYKSRFLALLEPQQGAIPN